MAWSCNMFACWSVNAMKRFLLVCTWMFYLQSAHAVPTGCFYADYGSSCYTGSFMASDCDQWNMTPYYFGNYISSMCSYVNSTESLVTSCSLLLGSCQSDVTTLINQRDNCTSVANSNEKNRQEWIAYSAKQGKLIKRLYKACGAKCKRIK